MQQLEETSNTHSVAFAIVAYSLCSSTLLLANKMALYFLPSIYLISFTQIVFAVLAVTFIKCSSMFNSILEFYDRIIYYEEYFLHLPFILIVLGHPVDKLELGKVKAYGIFVIIFLGSLMTNMKALSVSTIETIIVFRSCTPIAVSFVEYYFMNRELPNFRSAISLLGVAFGK